MAWTPNPNPGANPTPTSSESRLEQILLFTRDPEYLLNGQPIPVLTSFLYRVCDTDTERFDEAMRLVELYLRAALNIAGSDGAE